MSIFNDRRPIQFVSDERLRRLQQVSHYFQQFSEREKKSSFTAESLYDIKSAMQGFIRLCSACLALNIAVIPAYINSDVIENHFCQVRSLFNGSNDHPTYAHYMGLQTSILLTKPVGLPSKRNASMYIEPAE